MQRPCRCAVCRSQALAAADAKGTAIPMSFIVGADRRMPPADAVEMAKAAARVVESGDHMVNGRPGLVALGLASAEEGNPPEPFAEAFEIARKAGLVAVPHAGECAPAPGKGPDSVRFCMECLGAKRIEHGVLAMEDKGLVAKLAERKVCLDCCPTSNYLIENTIFLKEKRDHPLPLLMEAGVPCTINSDDPLLFGCDVLSEYRVCREELKLTDEQLASCARNSFVFSNAPEDIKKAGLEGVDTWLTAATV